MSTSNCSPCSDPSSSSGAPVIVSAGKYASVSDLYGNQRALKGKDNAVLVHRAYGKNPVTWADGSAADRISLENLYAVPDAIAKNLVAQDSSGQLVGFLPASAGGRKLLISQNGSMFWELQGESAKWFEAGAITEPEGLCQLSVAAFAGCDGNGALQLVKLPAEACGFLRANGTVGEPNPAGVAALFAGTSQTVPEGWLLCDGRILSQSEYPALFAAIGYNYGKSGSNFYIPDMRGLFPRGADPDLTGRDPDSAGRTSLNPGGNTAENVGSYQGDAFQCHDHAGGGITVTTSNTTIGPGNAKSINYVSKITVDGETDGVVPATCGIPRTSEETRPANVYWNFIISIGC